MPTCVGLEEESAAGDAPCVSVLLLLPVRVELGVAAGEMLCDRLGEPESEAGGSALDEADCDADCEDVAVGVSPLVTVCVAESVCDGVRDPDGEELAACDRVIPWVAVNVGEAEGVGETVPAGDPVGEPVLEAEAVGARERLCVKLGDAVWLNVLVALEVMLGEDEATWLPVLVEVSVCDGVADKLPPKEIAWLGVEN